MSENKNRNGREYPAVFLEDILTVTAENAREHADEFLDRINRENVAFIIRDSADAVVLVPYWWHTLSFGTDAKRIMEILFEESKWANDAEILKIEGIALGYIKLTTLETAQEILDTLLPQVDGYPYANHWHRLLNKLASYWNTDHEPKLMMAGFAEGRKVYLLFTDGKTRLVDIRKFIGHGLEEDDLKNELSFRACLTMVTEALVWMEVDGEVQATFSSEELLRESEPVDEETARKVWDFPSPNKPRLFNIRME